MGQLLLSMPDWWTSGYCRALAEALGDGNLIAVIR
jgi:hypothetical protein